MRWEGHVARIGGMRNAYKIFIGNSEGKRPLGRSRRRWEDNIRMDVSGKWWFRTGTILRPLVNTIMNLRFS
jgi:hypothetical protein